MIAVISVSILGVLLILAMVRVLVLMDRRGERQKSPRLAEYLKNFNKG